MPRTRQDPDSDAAKAKAAAEAALAEALASTEAVGTTGYVDSTAYAAAGPTIEVMSANPDAFVGRVFWTAHDYDPAQDGSNPGYQWVKRLKADHALPAGFEWVSKTRWIAADGEALKSKPKSTDGATKRVGVGVGRT